uniref:Secreted protein n=1 Tax=Panstrongylus lignarius TaxID=156445 RepID=A0A224XXY2_9HEMI
MEMCFLLVAFHAGTILMSETVLHYTSNLPTSDRPLLIRFQKYQVLLPDPAYCSFRNEFSFCIKPVKTSV